MTDALARCVGDVAPFLDQHWGRAPVHNPGRDANAFADVFSLDDVDHLVCSSFARAPAFRLVRDGQPIDPGRYTKSARLGGRTVTGVGDPRRVLDEFRAGATIVLQGLQRYWPPLAAFCRELELALTHPVQANAYVTPAGAQGLAVHYDTHDVFVLQVAGSKEWAVYDPVLVDPLPSQPWVSSRWPDAPGEPRLSVELRAGDSMYVPRGFLHSARAQRDLSAHVTIGVLAATWHDVVRDVVAAAADDERFRASLPPGFAADEMALTKDVDGLIGALRDWLGTVDAHAVASKVVRRFWSSRSAPLAGQLRQLLLVDRLHDRSEVRRRTGSICHLSVDVATGSLRVLLGDRELEMPPALEPAVRRVAGGAGGFRVGELADLMDEESRLVFTRRLVREGLLEITAVDA